MKKTNNNLETELENARRSFDEIRNKFLKGELK